MKLIKAFAKHYIKVYIIKLILPDIKRARNQKQGKRNSLDIVCQLIQTINPGKPKIN